MAATTTSRDIERELTKLAGKAGLANAIKTLRLMPAEGRVQVVVEKPWYRSGSETYLTVFALKGKSFFKSFVLKACVPSAMAIPIDDVLASWISKRLDILDGFDEAIAPALYGFGGGVILEEYIEHSLADVAGNTSAAVIRATRLLRHLVDKGYDPSLTYKDFRSRGKDAVIVDFGQDLGVPTQNPSMPAEEWIAYLVSIGVSVAVVREAMSQSRLRTS